MRKLTATAFTIVEMLVAVSIILLLVSLSFPAYQHIQEKVKISKVQNVEMRGLYQAVLLYKSPYGEFSNSQTISKFEFLHDLQLSICGVSFTAAHNLELVA